jgi:hypothetical protein
MTLNRSERDKWIAKLRQYFRNLAKVLCVTSETIASNHKSLRGTHRELVAQNYLSAILPKRFAYSSGEVLTSSYLSGQNDIIVYDALNFPILPHLGSNTIFLDAVKCCVEVKSTYSRNNLRDACVKSFEVTEACRLNLGGYVTPADEMNVVNEFRARAGRRLNNISNVSMSTPSPCTAAFFFKGGQRLGKNAPLEMISSTRGREALDALASHWPTLVLFLEPGILFKKRRLDRDTGTIVRYEAGDDALLLFTALLLREIGSRMIDMGAPDYFTRQLSTVFAAVPTLELTEPFGWTSSTWTSYTWS